MKKEFSDFLSDIDKSNINDKMIMIPSMVFDHGYNYAVIKSLHRELEDDLELISAQLTSQLRRKLVSTGEKSFTESRLKSLVIAHKDVIEVKEKLRESSTKLDKAKSYLEALKTAREILPNVSNNFREELRSTGKLIRRRNG